MQYQVAYSRTKNSKFYEPMTGIGEPVWQTMTCSHGF